MKQVIKEYKKLSDAFHRYFQLEHAKSILGWDEAVMMAPASGDARARAMTELSLIQHEILKDEFLMDDLKTLLCSSDKMQSLGSWERANIDEMSRYFQRANEVSSDLVEAVSLATMKSSQAWRVMRAENNWNDFLPLFKNVVQLTKEEATQRSEHSGLSKYDSMLNLFNPGYLSEDITKVFDNVKDFLPALVDKVIEKQKSEHVIALQGPFPIENQRKLGLTVMKILGFDFSRGRLDVSHHPFCGGVPEDVRTTTRYDLNSFLGSFMGVIHETGHALYEQGLPREWLNQPIGCSRGMAIHESQSLLFEKYIGRSYEFINHLRGQILSTLGRSEDNPAWTSKNIIDSITRVKKDLIRVDADEMTYPLHIIMRFEMERDLFDGKISTEDIPEVWDHKMKEYLNLSTEGNYKDGCMQDMHWPSGAFGYFPCYSLGAMIASQLMDTFKKTHNDYLDHFIAGDYSQLRDWLRQNIWSQGCLYSSNDLVKRITGQNINPIFLKNHLEKRYS